MVTGLRKEMYYMDTETVGLSGPAVLVQYAKCDSPEDITLLNPWFVPPSESLAIMEEINLKGYIAYNSTFDSFQFAKLINMLRLFKERHGDLLPVNHIEEMAFCERDSLTKLCVKPGHILDLYLHAVKGPYQSMLGRKDIRLKRIPTEAAPALVEVLNQELQFPDLFFARKADKTKRWGIYPVVDNGEPRDDLKDVVLKFDPSVAMKVLVQEIFGEQTLSFSEIMVEKKYLPVEKEYAPYALAYGSPENWNGTWPEVILHHLNHWENSENARYYARKDIEYLAKLDKYFKYPEVDDDDSVLAAMVGTVRLKGFKIDLDKVETLLNKAEATVASAELDFNRRSVCIDYLMEVLSDEEKVVLQTSDNKISTGAEILGQLVKKEKGDVCDKCFGMAAMGGECSHCKDGIVTTGELHPVAERAQVLIDYRTSVKEVDLYKKLKITGGRVHPDLKVIGAKSSRMSGTGGMSIHGTPHQKEVRSAYDLADPPETTLVGGDFVSYEVALLDAAFMDPVLREDLMRTHECYSCEGTGKVLKETKKLKVGDTCGECEGVGEVRTKIHGLFGTFLFPGHTYKQICQTKEEKGLKNLYTRAKSGVFALAYGGNAYTLVTKSGVEEEVAEKAYESWVSKYQVWGEKRQAIVDMFCTAVQQPNGMFTWEDPADYAESMFGFRRYFTAENATAKALFDLAENLPQSLKEFKGKVNRRDDRIQSIPGAIRSALYAACCGIQAANARAAANHLIQSAGAQKCKELQRRLWELQPVGVCEWIIQLLNIHDEIMAPCTPEVVPETKRIVRCFIDGLQQTVPLADMEWDVLKNWAEK